MAGATRGPAPRTAAVAAGELAQLLDRAGVPAPYLLVGHSFGGLVAQLFASQYPQRVAGLVLIDASHEAQFRRLERVGGEPPLAPTGRHFLIANHQRIPDGLPEELRLLARRLALAPDAVAALYAELGAMRWSAREAAIDTELPRVPVVVLVHDAVGQADSPAARERAQAWLALQGELAQRNSGGRLLVVQESGHHLHLDRPDVVIETIRSLLATFAKR